MNARDLVSRLRLMHGFDQTRTIQALADYIDKHAISAGLFDHFDEEATADHERREAINEENRRRQA